MSASSLKNNLMKMGYTNDRKRTLPTLAKACFPQACQTRFVFVYVCYFCGEEFTSREILQTHHTQCNMNVLTEAQQSKSPPEAAHSPADQTSCPADQTPSQPPSSPTKKSVYMVIHSQDEVHAPDSPRKIRVKESLTPLKTTGVQNSPFFSPSKFSKNKYLAGLGLMPIQKARRVSERRRSTKCENIDLDEDTLPSPTKPRTPKLLISHLSRDESGAAADNNRSCMRSLFSSQSSRVDGDGESDSHREGCERRDGKSDDYEKVSDRLRNVKSLFNIAVSSPLGQCVIKHYKGDPSLHILSDTESHCLTRDQQEQTGGLSPQNKAHGIPSYIPR